MSWGRSAGEATGYHKEDAEEKRVEGEGQFLKLPAQWSGCISGAMAGGGLGARALGRSELTRSRRAAAMRVR